jgi:endonuclease/exonuclease/phosphatase family metal-dependent hydrolase
MEGIDTSKMLCGDFNLRPDTQSLELLEHDMLNLIKSHKVTSTRTSLYPKDEKFADYIFVSKDITVNQFNVLQHEVSDHAPLLLEFE